jgi:hypothetical protein
MKQLFAILCLALLALSAVAVQAQETVDVYILAQVDEEFGALRGAEFAVANLPHTFGVVSVQWNTELTIGDLDTGIALAFSFPLAGPLALLGVIEILPTAEIGDDYQLSVEPSQWGNLTLVDLMYNEVPADGGLHTFNCSSACDCGIDSLPAIGLFTDAGGTSCDQLFETDITPNEESSWSRMKSLY